MEHMGTELSLQRHLKEAYGIQHFDDESKYWNWASATLSPARFRRLAGFMERFADGHVSQQTQWDFYQYISIPEIGSIAHSIKANAIAKTGAAVEPLLSSKASVLDLGCCTGYLTTWYAKRSRSRGVTGTDFSPRCIKYAGRKAEELGISNVEFVRMDITKSLPEKQFAAIVDTQTLCYLEDLQSVFRAIRERLRNDGVFISVPALREAESAVRYLQKMTAAGLVPKEVKVVFFSDLGSQGAYPMFIAGPSGTATDLDVGNLYKEIHVKLNGHRERKKRKRAMEWDERGPGVPNHVKI